VFIRVHPWLNLPVKSRGKDQLTKSRRSWNMSRIRGKHTTPEIAVSSLLHKMGYRFRLHVKIPVPENIKYPSRRRFIIPDIVFQPSLPLNTLHLDIVDLIDK
jgi:hypothetical protein